MGRGTFEKLSGIVRIIQPNHYDWRQVRYMLFELPEHQGTFTRRVRKMVKLTETLMFPSSLLYLKFAVIQRMLC